mgnify:FL=1
MGICLGDPCLGLCDQSLMCLRIDRNQLSMSGPFGSLGYKGLSVSFRECSEKKDRIDHGMITFGD